MRKRVYLHIGWEKTGTSAIQVFCARNQDWLNERNIHYPLMGKLPQHVDLYTDLKDANASRIRRSCEAVRAEIARCEQESLIFSHESLHLCSPAIFADIFKGCDVRIIAYLRRPDEAFISFFVTMARYGLIPVDNLHRSIRKFSHDHINRFEYKHALAGFAWEFGRDMLTVRHYHPDDLIGRQTLTDFMHQLGIEDLENSKWPEDHSNLSLDADQFAIVLRLARSLRALPKARVCELTRQLSDAMILHGSPNHARSVVRFVPASLRHRLLAHWKDSFEALYAEYFDGRAIFDDESWAKISKPSPAMTPERLDELIAIVHQADVLSAPESTQFLDSLHQLTH